MNPENEQLEQVAENFRIRVHEPFAEFLNAKPIMHSFSLSLLDCYKAADHACHAITGAFLVTDTAVEKLFPETGVCERGDLEVEFGSSLEERATGPRSNIISYITGAWAESGFPGLKGNFKRKGLLTYGNAEIGKSAVKFRRISTGKAVVIEYDPTELLTKLSHKTDFPEKWRVEICEILKDPAKVLRVSEDALQVAHKPTDGCC